MINILNVGSKNVMKRILIIEDEPDFRKILASEFRKAGFEIILASDGKQGIIESVKSKPDFILLDLIMPGMNGTSFLRHFTQIDNLKEIPVAVLTVVPEDVPEKLQGSELFKNIVGYWVKDKMTITELIKLVKDYLNIDLTFVN